MAARTTIHDLLEAAGGRLRRLDPREASDAVAAGAVLIVIRSERRRERDGVIPGGIQARRADGLPVEPCPPDPA